MECVAYLVVWALRENTVFWWKERAERVGQETKITSQLPLQDIKINVGTVWGFG
jgi:hypothetical protein